MTNEEFLRRLESALVNRLPPEELKNVMDYHREYFAEAGENAAAELDPPEVIAQRVLDEYNAGQQPSKRKYHPLAITLAAVIAVAVVVAGIAAATVGFVSNRVISKLPNFGNGVIETAVMQGTANTVEDVAISQVDGTEILGISAEDFDSISVDGSTQSVLICAGADPEVLLQYNATARWDYEVKNNTLYVTETFPKNSPNSHQADLLIMVPQGKTLDYIEMNLDVGDANLSEITAKTAHLDADMGKIDVEGCEITELTCEADMGDITVGGSTVHTLSCHADMGAINIGEVDANDADLEAEVGAVTAIFLGKTSDYSLDLETELGKVMVNGLDVARSYQTSGGSKKVEISTEVGAIMLDFAS